MYKVFSLLAFLFIITCTVSAQLQWMPIESTPSPANSGRYEDMFFTDYNTGYIIRYDGTMYKTTNAGTNWTNIFSINNALFRSIGFFDANTGVMGTLRDSIPMFRTTNAGANWQKISSYGGTGIAPKGICGISIANENVAYGVGRYYCPTYLVKTTNKGANWNSIQIDTSLARSLIDCHFWSADSGIVVGGYAGNNIYVQSVAVILLTTDGGQTFTRVFKSNRVGEFCWKISFPSRNTGYVSIEATNYAAFIKTTNGGFNWTDALIPGTNDLEGIGFINNNTGWVGGWGGLTFKTSNGGANWVSDPWGQNVNRFRIFNDTFAYSVGTKMYKFSRIVVGVQSSSTTIPDKFSLSQNYPNPFNPTTRITYSIPENNFVSLKIYNTSGMEVQSLIEKNQIAGSYTVNFDAFTLPSGIYYYKLSSKSFSETKKMVLIK